MARNDFLRFPSDKESEKYQYTRTPAILMSIIGLAVLCVLSLALYATLAFDFFLPVAAIGAGGAFALWFLTKSDVDQ